MNNKDITDFFKKRLYTIISIHIDKIASEPKLTKDEKIGELEYMKSMIIGEVDKRKKKVR